MTFLIAGIGLAVPEHRIAQEEAARLAVALCGAGTDRERRLAALYRRAAVRYRHSVLLEPRRDGLAQSFYPAAASDDDRGPSTRKRMERYDLDAGPLALRAGRRALCDARVPASEVTHLITVSCTGFAAPGVDMSLIQGLGLAPGVSRTHVGFMGCHGAMNAMTMGAAIIAGDPDAWVLITAVELCSLHQQYGWNPERIVANALFSDGAAAIVACAGSMATGDGDTSFLASGSTRIDQSREMMTWKIGDHGFEMTLSPQVPDLLRKHLRGWLVDWLGGMGLSLADIASWAIHPGGPRILSACAETLGLTPEAMAPSREVLGEFGNMSSPTVLFIVERLRRAGAPKPWVVLGFGPGLAIEAVLLGESGR